MLSPIFSSIALVAESRKVFFLGKASASVKAAIFRRAMHDLPNNSVAPVATTASKYRSLGPEIQEKIRKRLHKPCYVCERLQHYVNNYRFTQSSQKRSVRRDFQGRRCRDFRKMERGFRQEKSNYSN